MVLEEASIPLDSFSSDTAPSSDADPYSGDRSPTELTTRDSSYISVNSGRDTVYVNLSQLPKAWGFRSSVPYPPTLLNAISQSCAQAEQVLGRPVKQEEADALAFHFAKSVRIASYGAPAGIAVAGVLAYRGMEKFKFPGYTPGEKFNADKFLNFKGQRARFMWQITRFNAYGTLGAVMGQIFFGSYALTVGTAGRVMDPRLKTLMEALQKQDKSGTLPGNRQVDQSPGQKQGETFDMARQRQRAQEAFRNNSARQQETRGAKAESGVDDMSPTGGAFGAEFVDLGSAAVSDTAMMSDDQARRQSEGIERQQEASYEKSRESQRTQIASQRRQEPANDAFSTEEESRPPQSGSAWERLRKQASSGRSPPSMSRSPAPAADRETPSSDDGFAFSSGDEEKQLAKTEAQKQFDTRLERERSGKGFEDKRRW